MLIRNLRPGMKRIAASGAATGEIHHALHSLGNDLERGRERGVFSRPGVQPVLRLDGIDVSCVRNERGRRVEEGKQPSLTNSRHKSG